jgi:hypothetical protein
LQIEFCNLYYRGGCRPPTYLSTYAADAGGFRKIPITQKHLLFDAKFAKIENSAYLPDPRELYLAACLSHVRLCYRPSIKWGVRDHSRLELAKAVIFLACMESTRLAVIKKIDGYIMPAFTW